MPRPYYRHGDEFVSIHTVEPLAKAQIFALNQGPQFIPLHFPTADFPEEIRPLIRHQGDE